MKEQWMQKLILQIESVGKTIADNAEKIAGCYKHMMLEPISISIDFSDESLPVIRIEQRISPDDLIY